jgi:hypothetical protein
MDPVFQRDDDLLSRALASFFVRVESRSMRALRIELEIHRNFALKKNSSGQQWAFAGVTSLDRRYPLYLSSPGSNGAEQETQTEIESYRWSSAPRCALIISCRIAISAAALIPSIRMPLTASKGPNSFRFSDITISP